MVETNRTLKKRLSQNENHKTLPIDTSGTGGRHIVRICTLVKVSPQLTGVEVMYETTTYPSYGVSALIRGRLR